jgi:hypothetical protein
MVRVPSNSNLTPGGTKGFPAAAACGWLEMRRSGQISGANQGSRRLMSGRGGLAAAVGP